MPKTYYDHRDVKWPGTWLVENQLPSAIPEIPFNRTLYVQQFTDEAPDEAEFVDDCQTIQQIFDRFQPSKTVEFKDEDDLDQDVELQFRSLRDFGREGIIEQSELLNRIALQQELYENFLGKLTDDKLAVLLANPEEKAAYLSVIDSLIADLEAAGAE